ncbi:MAG: ABC transporter ATP-binding protein [Candidatus Rokubacteria bacterium]|nr:ABC transporter ATP-binding protein [Candidatus Rokubacteria bacterium]
MTAPALLALSHVSKRFGGLPVLVDVSLGLAGGRVQALIGPNGAGKTTLLNIVSGFLAPDSGTVRFSGGDLHGWPASRRVRAGLARTFQLVQIFGDMTVRENVLCGFHLQVRQSLLTAVAGTRRFHAEEHALRGRADELLGLVDLTAYAGEPAGRLPFGLQRRLEIARALATRPAMLLLDEPCAGLGGPEVEHLAALLRRLAADGLGLLLVEHNMPFVLGVAEHVTVLDAGEIIADGRPDAVRANPRVVEAYLGEAEHVVA